MYWCTCTAPVSLSQIYQWDREWPTPWPVEAREGPRASPRNPLLPFLFFFSLFSFLFFSMPLGSSTSTSSSGCQVLQQVRAALYALARADPRRPTKEESSYCARKGAEGSRETRAHSKGAAREDFRGNGGKQEGWKRRVAPCTWPIYSTRLRTARYVALSIGLDPWPQPGTTYYLLGHLNHPRVPSAAPDASPSRSPRRAGTATLAIRVVSTLDEPSVSRSQPLHNRSLGGRAKVAQPIRLCRNALLNRCFSETIHSRIFMTISLGRFFIQNYSDSWIRIGWEWI